MLTGIIVLVIVVLIVLFLIVAYNGLVKARNRVDNAFSQIEVQQKRRYDLIPNLVETVKGYAAARAANARSRHRGAANAISAQQDGTLADQAQAENALTGTLKSLFAVAEAYPDLKANQNFLNLQEELTATEDRIAYSRQFFNDSVLSYNNAIQTFPRNLLAGMFKFEKREFFDAEPEASGPVQVQF